MKYLIMAAALMFSDFVFSQEVAKVAFIEEGINIYGKFYFESSLGGDKFNVTDQNHRELVPAGAVLSVLKPNYTIGSFRGEIEVKSADKVISIKKVFFELRKSGEIHFYYPSEDDEFLGKKIEGVVSFK